MGNLGKIGKPQKSKKHKKLKPVDPFNRGGRRTSSQDAKRDKTPKGNQLDEQEITRSMREFIKNKRMMEEQLKNPKKKEKKKKDGKMNDFQNNDDRKGMMRPMRKVPEFHRKKGERDGRLIGRAEAAARDVLGESRFEDKYKLNANPTREEVEEKKNKKDEWKRKKAARREKKKRKKKGEDVSDEILALHKKNKEENEKKRLEAAAAAASSSSTAAATKELTDFSDLKDVVEFGEVVLAPPTLTARPRKAEAKDERRNNNLLLNAIIDKNGGNKNNKNNNNNRKEINNKNGGKSQLRTKTQKLKTLSALQKSNLLNERQKVVDKYRKLKIGSLGKIVK